MGSEMCIRDRYLHRAVQELDLQVVLELLYQRESVILYSLLLFLPFSAPPMWYWRGYIPPTISCYLINNLHFLDLCETDLYRCFAAEQFNIDSHNLFWQINS